MPKGYWIVRVSIKNAQNYPDYLAAAVPAFEKYRAKFRVRGGRYIAPEGTARDRNVVVEFEDYQTALACYHASEYETARAIRQANAEADFLIIEGG